MVNMQIIRRLLIGRAQYVDFQEGNKLNISNVKTCIHLVKFIIEIIFLLEVRRMGSATECGKVMILVLSVWVQEGNPIRPLPRLVQTFSL